MDIRRVIKRLIVPQYNELVLYLTSISFVLVFIFYSDLHSYVYHFVFDNFDYRVFIFLLMPVAGIAFSIFHVFTDRKSNDFEKIFMLMFMVVVNFATGIAAGIHQLSDHLGWYLVFPAWNMINAGLLFLLYVYSVLDESDIVDGRPTVAQTAAGSVVVLVILVIGHFFLRMHWAITLSMCITYACTMSGVFQKRVRVG